MKSAWPEISIADMRLLRIAEGDLPKDAPSYLQLKAIEALGRLRTAGAEAILRKIAETRRAFRWASPSELRLVASQAMEKIDPEWVRDFVPRSGLSVAEFSIEPLDLDTESSAIRQRRYPRLRLEHSVAATTTNLKENCRLEIPELTLGGGVAVCEQSLHPGSLVNLRLNDFHEIRESAGHRPRRQHPGPRLRSRRYGTRRPRQAPQTAGQPRQRYETNLAQGPSPPRHPHLDHPNDIAFCARHTAKLAVRFLSLVILIPQRRE